VGGERRPAGEVVEVITAYLEATMADEDRGRFEAQAGQLI
jgi:hypothetical protein